MKKHWTDSPPSYKKGVVKLKNEMEQLRGSYFNKI